MHGHQIRRAAQIDRTELWADVKPGSLYGALHRMATDNVIEVVAHEQDGNLPARTVYAITDHGRAELRSHRDALLRDTRLRPDPVDLALQYTDDLTAGQLHDQLVQRRSAVAAQLADWRALHEQAAPFLVGLEAMTFEHNLIRLRAELAWHDQLVARLPELLATPATPSPETEPSSS